MKTIRISWLDISKGFAIILMVLGHASIPREARHFIWAFHMPLFFIASGWTSNFPQYTVFSYFRKKVRTLLCPFFIYSIIVLSLQSMISRISLLEWLKFGWGAYALWFIPVLFVSSFLVRLINEIPRFLFRLIALITLLCIAIWLSYNSYLLPWNLSAVPYACLLIHLGSIIKKYQNYIVKPKLYIVLGLLYITFSISQIWHLDMCFNLILPIVPITIGAVAGTLYIFMISALIEKYNKVLTNVFVAIGRETYVILAFSQIIIIFLNTYTSFNSLLKYCVLVFCLVVLTWAKDGINKLFQTKII